MSEREGLLLVGRVVSSGLAQKQDGSIISQGLYRLVVEGAGREYRLDASTTDIEYGLPTPFATELPGLKAGEPVCCKINPKASVGTNGKAYVNLKLVGLERLNGKA